MKIKTWQILVIVALGISAFCLVCLASLLLLDAYILFSATPTELANVTKVPEITGIAHQENTGVPFPKAMTEVVVQATQVEQTSSTATLIAIPSLTLAPTSDVSMTAAAPCVMDSNPQRGIVTKVVDGDTINVAIDNHTFPVRYIGMDTPEPGESMGLQAKTQNALFVEGKSVTLYRDKSETDKYDRLLRYVFVGGLFINYEMVKTGYAEAKSYSPDTACDSYFAQTQIEAMAASLGLWGVLPPTEARISSPIVVGTTSNCDPAYPTVCIPPPPPDLDCPDIPYTNFKVLPPDPHNFDGNGDGVGCEGP